MREVPYYPSGRDYLCRFCGQAVPDGATVLGVWDDGDNLLGVRAEDSDGGTIHVCGQPVAGDALTNAQRVEAKQDEAYAAETGA